jgi:hypothetical protein
MTPALETTSARHGGLPRRGRGTSWLLFWTTLLGFVLLVAPASAHLVAAQRGTLNFVGEGAFLVLSVPASAFGAADGDRDGKLSPRELAWHREAIVERARQHIHLLDESTACALDILDVRLAPPDETPMAPASQLVVLGRFATGTAQGLRFRIDLPGKAPAEQRFYVTATRDATGQRQLLVLDEDRRERALFPGALATFAAFVVSGATHIFEGPDHLLFLLVVLLAGWSRRDVVLALSLFTLGHATTLVLVRVAGLSLSPAIVEPLIAATIVGMAAFDLSLRRRGLAQTGGAWRTGRFSLVFGCALIHGAGLASALTELGLEQGQIVPSLAGFNVGIELAQLAVAIGAALLASSARTLVAHHRFVQPLSSPRLQHALSIGAIVVGAGWFLQRVVGQG